MTLVTTILAAAEEGHHGNVALETVVFFGIALVIFTALGLVVFSYRDVANRHAGKAQAFADSHGTASEHGAVEHRTGSGH